MGTSTNAYLAWGIDLGEMELPEYLACAYDDWGEWAESELEGSGVSIETHCSYDYPMYVLCVASFWASRGCPLELDQKQLGPPEPCELFDEKLRGACERLGIDPRPGGWLLFSLWC